MYGRRSEGWRIEGCFFQANRNQAQRSASHLKRRLLRSSKFRHVEVVGRWLMDRINHSGLKNDQDLVV
jgi:hypothetical protein